MGKCQKGRYPAAAGSTATAPVERFPARAAAEGSVESSYPFRLPDTLVIREEKCAVLDNWTTNGSAKLIALEGWNGTDIEVILGIQVAVAQELVRAAVKIIGAGTRDRIYYAARGLSVLGGVVTGQD